MHSTPRLINRAWRPVLGAVLMLAGVLGIASGTVHDATRRWVTSLRVRGTEFAPTWWGQDTLPGVTWGTIVLLTTAAAIVVLLITLVVRQGGGRSRVALEDRSSAGRITVTAPVVHDLLKEGLEANPQLDSARVSTFNVRGRTVVRVSVTPHATSTPQTARRAVTDTVTALDRALGTSLPVFVEVLGP